MGSRFFPVSRIVSRNGQTWDYPGRTRGAEGHKKSGPMTAQNLVYDCGFPNGAKRIRTADPLHAMQVLYQLSYGPKSRNVSHVNQFKDFFRNVRNSYSTL